MTTAELTAVDGLTILLTAQSLILAAFGLVVTMGAPGQRRPLHLLGGPKTVGSVAVVVQWMVGTGSGFAWSSLFVGRWPSTAAGMAVAVAILVAIVGEATLAGLLGWALASSAWRDPAGLE